MLSFTPTNGNAVSATSSTTAFSSTSAAADDDGIFDALYWFSVPATTTGGTLSVQAGQVTGMEFTGFVGSGNAVPIDVSAPVNVSLSFPAGPSAEPSQRTPPWVGAPLPATGVAASGPAGGLIGTHSSHGFPIWAAVLALLILAGALVLVQRLRRRATAEASFPVPPAGPIFAEAVTIDGPTDAMKSPVQETLVAPGPMTEMAPEPDCEVGVNFMGPRRFVGLGEPPSRILEAILTYLVCHDGHHLSSDQIQLGMWPLGRDQGELKPKTFLNYLSQLRGWVNSEHLPDAALSGGYLIEGVSSDWASFRRLNAQADRVGGNDARAMRTEALALVRGRPFEGLSGDGYQWVDEERFLSTMTRAVVSCTRTLAGDLAESGDYVGAQDAVEAGLRGARNEYVLWELGARCIAARGEGSALERWLTEAGHHLVAGDVERIRAALGHQDPPVA
jgi:hypothetical protein